MGIIMSVIENLIIIILEETDKEKVEGYSHVQERSSKRCYKHRFLSTKFL